MKTSDFFYELPAELIAQTPLEKRDSSRLMLLDKRTGEIGHSVFSCLPEYLRETAVALLPILVIFLVFQVLSFRMNRRSFWKKEK